MTSAERRAHNRIKHAQQRQARAGQNPREIAVLWWDEARKIARDRAENGDETAWAHLARTLENFCNGYSE
jgi:hypothetical protein